MGHALTMSAFAWGGLAAGLALLAWVDLLTAGLVVAANLFGLAVAWIVTRVFGLPRDGSLRTEVKPEPPRIAGRINPAGDK